MQKYVHTEAIQADRPSINRMDFKLLFTNLPQGEHQGKNVSQLPKPHTQLHGNDRMQQQQRNVQIWENTQYA